MEKESLPAESVGQFGLEELTRLQTSFCLSRSATQVVRIAGELDREIATPDEARAILKLKGMDKVNFWRGNNCFAPD